MSSISNISGETVHSQLKWRYATKQFDPNRKISDTDWNALEQALVLAPSSFGLQPWKFLVITNPDIKAQLPAISWNQSQPRDCSHMVVLAFKRDPGVRDIDRLIQRTADVRCIPVESLDGFRKMLLGSLTNPPFDIHEWGAKQVYIALGQFMCAAAMMGIDTCPMEGLEPDKYDELLGLRDQGYATCVGCAAGYRSQTDKYGSLPKVRFPTSEVVQRI